MKSSLSTLLASLFMLPLAAAAEDEYTTVSSAPAFPGHPEWLACEHHDECIIGHSTHCRHEFSVNKNYLKQAQQAASANDRCESMPRDPEGIAAECVNHACVTVFPAPIDAAPGSLPEPAPSQR